MFFVAGCRDDTGEDFRFEGKPGQATEARLDVWTPFIEAQIDESETRDFLVDTGAPLTHLDSEVYALSDVIYGDISAFGLRFLDRPLAPIELFGGKILCSGLNVGGLLGGDLLHAFQLAGDYYAGRLYLFDDLVGDVPSEAALEPETTVDVSILGGGLVCVDPSGPNCEGATIIEIAPNRVVVSVEIEGHAANFLLDTGASFVSISPVFLKELGGDARPFIGQVSVQGQAGKFQADVTRLASIVLSGGAGALESVPTLVLQDEDLLVGISSETGVTLRGLLGGTYLREFLFVVDYPNERLHLSRYAEPDHVDRREFIGPGFELILCSDTYRISEIYEDTGVSETHDLALGDAVVAIEGNLLAGKSIVEVDNLIRSVEPGTTIEFTINREGSRPDGDEEIEILDLLPDYVP